MADAAFDEFGNFIGAGKEDGSDDDGSASDAPVQEEEEEEHGGGGSDAEEQERREHPGPHPGPSRSIMLHEDRQYYPDPEDVYGPSTEVCHHLRFRCALSMRKAAVLLCSTASCFCCCCASRAMLHVCVHTHLIFALTALGVLSFRVCVCE